MKEQPEALRLADRLDLWGDQGDLLEAAAELRRLHEVNQELLEALKEAADALEIASNGGGVNFYQYAKEARAAIAKATGEQA
jgi:hypothetical protein